MLGEQKIRALFLFLVFGYVCGFCGHSYATQQIKDTIQFEGKEYIIEEHPFDQNSYLAVNYPAFDEDTTANWKAYEAGWSIENNQLYLVSFKAQKNGRPVKVSDIFSGNNQLPIKADWYTGPVTIFMGDIKYEFGELVPEEVVVLRINSGDVIFQGKLEKIQK